MNTRSTRVIAEIIGGLGNQMFEYAAARALSLHCNARLEIDITPFKNYELRKYELDVFQIEEHFTDISLFKKLNSQSSSRMKRVLKRVLRAMYRFKTDLRLIREKEYFVYEKDFFDHCGHDVYLIGYWQSYHYFSRYRDTIVKDFTPKTSPTGRNAELIEFAKNSAVVSLHVRRGDYISNPEAAKFHGGCTPPEYYEAAIHKVTSELKAGTFFVFSDDIPWCRENMKFAWDAIFIDHNSGRNAFEDIRLMQNCSAHIIANSSFSWWGAWLAGEKSKLVIAPKRWTRELDISYDDLIPRNWVRI